MYDYPVRFHENYLDVVTTIHSSDEVDIMETKRRAKQLTEVDSG